MNKSMIGGRGLAFVLAMAAAAACTGPNAEQAAQIKADSAQISAVSAEKDSLLREVMENTKLMSDISAEMAKVKDLKKPVVPQVAGEHVPTYRDSVLMRVKELTVRINESEQRLAASEKRLAGMESNRKEAIALRKQVAEFKAVIENQRATIDNLNEQLGVLTAVNDTLRQERARLAEDKFALADTISTLTTEKNTVYYIIGSKKDLLEKGVVVEEGSKFLIFGSKTLQPARSLDPTAFTAIDRRAVLDIQFPDSTKNYKIVTRQDLTALSPPPEKDTKLTRGIRIASPDAFWAPSKYLIIVEG